MTSTNDGKDVKSNPTSGQKGKTYFIELYKSLDANLNAEGSLSERVAHLGAAWRRVHTLCLHSAPSTHPHLLAWIQRHTARTVFQSEWQSPTSKDEHENLTEAINDFILQCENAARSRDGCVHPWESQLVARAEWFKGVLRNPWEHPVLKALLEPKGQSISNDDILEWLKEERGVVFAARLRQLALSKKCDDLVLALLTPVMDRVRACRELVPDTELTEEGKETPEPKEKEPTFQSILTEEAGFNEVWDLLTDMEFVLLHKCDKNARLIDLLKVMRLDHGYQVVERLLNKLEVFPKEKRIWKNAKDVATLIIQVMITRCMVVPRCSGQVLVVLYWMSCALVRAVPAARIARAAAALCAPACSARHLHTFANAVNAQQMKISHELKPYVVELYVRAITTGMNELEKLKLKPEFEEKEARATESMLASWFIHLGQLLSASARLKCECILTAFSVHPSPAMYERIKTAPALPARPQADIQPKQEPEMKSEFGSWANDSRTQTNFVKTSEHLNMQATQHQANVLSTTVLNEGDVLGLDAELCQDIIVLLSGPRVKTLSWDMERQALLDSCRTHMERTHFGTRTLTTELKYLNLDPTAYQHLPVDTDDEDDVYYGIEKGYEHLIEIEPAPEEIWEDAYDPERTDSAHSNYKEEITVRKKKTKQASSDSETDPLSLVSEKKERPHSKERSKERKKKSKDDKTKDTKDKEHTEKRKDPNKKKEKKERKKREKKEAKAGEQIKSRLIGVKVTKVEPDESNQNVTETDHDSQGKASEGIDATPAIPAITTLSNQLSAARQRAINAIQKAQMANSASHNTSKSNVSIRDEVKKSISKLIQFRRQKAADSGSSTSSSPQQPSTSRAPTPPSPLIGTKVAHTNLVFNKQQNELLNSMRGETKSLKAIFYPPDKTDPKPCSRMLAFSGKVPRSPREMLSRSHEVLNLSTNNVSINQTVASPLNNRTVASPLNNLQNLSDLRSPSQMKRTDSTHLSSYERFLQELQKNTDVGFFTSEPEPKSDPKPKPPRKPRAPKKKQMRPISRVEPVIPNIKVESNLTETENVTTAHVKSEPRLYHPVHAGAKQESLLKIEPRMSQTVTNLDAMIKTESRMSQTVTNLDAMIKTEPRVSQATHTIIPQEAMIKIEPRFSQAMQTVAKQDSMNKIEPRVSQVTHSMIKQEPMLSPQSAKPIVQPKKVDVTPNTFARLSYEKNKNKLNEKYKQQADTLHNDISDEIDRRIADLRLAKSKAAQSNIDYALSRAANATQSKPKEPPRVEMQKIEPISENAHNQQHPLLENILRHNTNVASPNDSPNAPQKPRTIAQPKHTALTEKDQQDLLRLLGQKNILSRPQIQINLVKNTQNAHKSSTQANVLSNRSTTPKPMPVQNPTLTTSKPINVQNHTVTIESKGPQGQSAGTGFNFPMISNLTIMKTTAMVQNKVQMLPKQKKTKLKASKHFIAATPDIEVNKNQETSKKYVPKPPVVVSKFNEDLEEQDWTKVLDAIRAHKTPSRGPNALDMLLNKDSFEKTKETNQIMNSPLSVSKQNNNTPTPQPTMSTQANSTIRQIDSSTIRQTKQTMFKKQIMQTLKQENVIEAKKIDLPNPLKLYPEVTKQSQPQELHKEPDPFISGIPNSDYEILEELMDDDLRQEIGELLSDEDSYCAQTVTMSKRCKNIEVKNQNIGKKVKKLDFLIHPKSNISNSPTTSSFPTNTKAKPQIISNEKVDIRFKNLVGSKIIRQDSKLQSGIIYNVNNTLASANNTSTTTASMTYNNTPTSSQQNLVIVNPYGKTCNVNQNYVAVNNTTNVVHQQFTAATPDQIIIRRKIVPNVITPVATINVTFDDSLKSMQPDVSLLHMPEMPVPTITVQTNISKTNQPFVSTNVEPEVKTEIQSKLIKRDKEQITEPKIASLISSNIHTVDPKLSPTKIDAPKTTERKVLSEVQEKLTIEPKTLEKAKIETKVPEKIDSDSILNQRFSFESEKSPQALKDQERLIKKRMSIINRNISSHSVREAIALTYTPLIEFRPNATTDKKQNDIELENNTKITVNTNHNRNEEEKSSCRRILLRSSNKVETGVSKSNNQGCSNKSRLKGLINSASRKPEENKSNAISVKNKFCEVKPHLHDSVERTDHHAAFKVNSLEKEIDVTPTQVTNKLKPKKKTEKSKVKQAKPHLNDDVEHADNHTASKVSNLEKEVDVTTTQVTKKLKTKKNTKKTEKSKVKQAKNTADIAQHQIKSNKPTSTYQEANNKSVKENQIRTKKIFDIEDAIEGTVIPRAKDTTDKILTIDSKMIKAEIKSKNILSSNTNSIVSEFANDVIKIPSSPEICKENQLNQHKCKLPDNTEKIEPAVKDAGQKYILSETKHDDKSTLKKTIEDNVHNIDKSVLTPGLSLENVSAIHCDGLEPKDIENTTVSQKFNKLVDDIESAICAITESAVSSPLLDTEPLFDMTVDEDVPEIVKIKEKNISLLKVITPSTKIQSMTKEKSTCNFRDKVPHVKDNKPGHTDLTKGAASYETKRDTNVKIIDNESVLPTATENKSKKPKPIETKELHQNSLFGMVSEVITIDDDTEPSDVVQGIDTNYQNKKSLAISMDQKETMETVDAVHEQVNVKLLTKTPVDGIPLLKSNFGNNDKDVISLSSETDLNESKITDTESLIALNDRPFLKSILMDNNNKGVVTLSSESDLDKSILIDNNNKGVVTSSSESDLYKNKTIDKNKPEKEHKLVTTHANNANLVIQAVPQSYKDSIKIEEIPIPGNINPFIKCVRIVLPNNKSYKATLKGKVNTSVDSLFEEPALKNLLLSGLSDKKRYCLNIQQLSTADNRVVGTQIHGINVQQPLESRVAAKTTDIVNLISDDEDEEMYQTIEIESDSFKVKNIDEKTFSKHKDKLRQKCAIKLQRCDQKRNTEVLVQALLEDLALNKPPPPTEVIEIDDSSDEETRIDVLKDMLLKQLDEAQKKLTKEERDDVQTNFAIGRPSRIRKSKYHRERDSRTVSTEPVIRSSSQPKISENSKTSRGQSFSKDCYSKIITRDCFVKLINCDNLVKVMCEKPQSIDDEVIECVSDDDLPSISRSGSYSILNELDDLDDPLLPKDGDREDRESSPVMRIFENMYALGKPENSGRNSPVMEAFDMIVVLRQSSRENLHKMPHVPENNVCQSDYFESKSITHMQNLSYQTSSIDDFFKEIVQNKLDVSTDCETDAATDLSIAESENIHGCTITAPRLTTIMSKYFEDNPIVYHLSTNYLKTPQKRKFQDSDDNASNKLIKICHPENIGSIVAHQKDAIVYEPKSVTGKDIVHVTESEDMTILLTDATSQPNLPSLVETNNPSLLIASEDMISLLTDSVPQPNSPSLFETSNQDHVIEMEDRNILPAESVSQPNSPSLVETSNQGFDVESEFTTNRPINTSSTPLTPSMVETYDQGPVIELEDTTILPIDAASQPNSPSLVGTIKQILGIESENTTILPTESISQPNSPFLVEINNQDYVKEIEDRNILPTASVSQPNPSSVKTSNQGLDIESEYTTILPIDTSSTTLSHSTVETNDQGLVIQSKDTIILPTDTSSTLLSPSMVETNDQGLVIKSVPTNTSSTALSPSMVEPNDQGIVITSEDTTILPTTLSTPLSSSMVKPNDQGLVIKSEDTTILPTDTSSTPLSPSMVETNDRGPVIESEDSTILPTDSVSQPSSPSLVETIKQVLGIESEDTTILPTDSVSQPNSPSLVETINQDLGIESEDMTILKTDTASLPNCSSLIETDNQCPATKSEETIILSTGRVYQPKSQSLVEISNQDHAIELEDPTILSTDSVPQPNSPLVEPSNQDYAIELEDTTILPTDLVSKPNSPSLVETSNQDHVIELKDRIILPTDSIYQPNSPSLVETSYQGIFVGSEETPILPTYMASQPNSPPLMETTNQDRVIEMENRIILPTESVSQPNSPSMVETISQDFGIESQDMAILKTDLAFRPNCPSLIGTDNQGPVEKPEETIILPTDKAYQPKSPSLVETSNQDHVIKLEDRIILPTDSISQPNSPSLVETSYQGIFVGSEETPILPTYMASQPNSPPFMETSNQDRVIEMENRIILPTESVSQPNSPSMVETISQDFGIESQDMAILKTDLAFRPNCPSLIGTDNQGPVEKPEETIILPTDKAYQPKSPSLVETSNQDHVIELEDRIILPTDSISQPNSPSLVETSYQGIFVGSEETPILPTYMASQPNSPPFMETSNQDRVIEMENRIILPTESVSQPNSPSLVETISQDLCIESEDMTILETDTAFRPNCPSLIETDNQGPVEKSDETIILSTDKAYQPKSPSLVETSNIDHVIELEDMIILPTDSVSQLNSPLVETSNQGLVIESEDMIVAATDTASRPYLPCLVETSHQGLFVKTEETTITPTDMASQSSSPSLVETSSLLIKLNHDTSVINKSEKNSIANELNTEITVNDPSKFKQLTEDYFSDAQKYKSQSVMKSAESSVVEKIEEPILVTETNDIEKPGLATSIIPESEVCNAVWPKTSVLEYKNKDSISKSTEETSLINLEIKNPPSADVAKVSESNYANEPVRKQYNTAPAPREQIGQDKIRKETKPGFPEESVKDEMNDSGETYVSSDHDDEQVNIDRYLNTKHHSLNLLKSETSEATLDPEQKENSTVLMSEETLPIVHNAENKEYEGKNEIEEPITTTSVSPNAVIREINDGSILQANAIKESTSMLSKEEIFTFTNMIVENTSTSMIQQSAFCNTDTTNDNEKLPTDNEASSCKELESSKEVSILNDDQTGLEECNAMSTSSVKPGGGISFISSALKDEDQTSDILEKSANDFQIAISPTTCKDLPPDSNYFQMPISLSSINTFAVETVSKISNLELKKKSTLNTDKNKSEPAERCISIKNHDENFTTDQTLNCFEVQSNKIISESNAYMKTKPYNVNQKQVNYSSSVADSNNMKQNVAVSDNDDSQTTKDCILDNDSVENNDELKNSEESENVADSHEIDTYNNLNKDFNNLRDVPFTDEGKICVVNEFKTIDDSLDCESEIKIKEKIISTYNNSNEYPISPLINETSKNTVKSVDVDDNYIYETEVSVQIQDECNELDLNRKVPPEPDEPQLETADPTRHENSDCIGDKEIIVEKTIEEVECDENIFENNATLVYKDDSGVILKGIEYEDPEMGTCYVFPLAKSSDGGSSEVLNSSVESTIEVIQMLETSTEEDDTEYNEQDLQVLKPKFTYSKRNLKRKSNMKDVTCSAKRSKRNSRSRDSSEVKIAEKKYRKGKNIDAPKLSATAIAESSNVKDFKRRLDYYSTVGFSYSITFSTEFIDPTEHLHNWPMSGPIESVIQEDEIDYALFNDLDNINKTIRDPLQQTLVEEIMADYNDADYPNSQTEEINFNMGFGEGSGRVKQNLSGSTISNFSAATLSDVKHIQPCLLSENLGFMKSSEQELQTIKRHLSYVQLKEKVRSFFKSTTFELTRELEEKDSTDDYNASSFPFELFNSKCIAPFPTETVVQVVQVGQLPVSAAAQNPVTCDPRVTQVSDASPSQCSVENSPHDDSQPDIKTEYTELTTADLNLPTVDNYVHRNQTLPVDSQNSTNMAISSENIPIETELVKSEVKIELEEESPEEKENDDFTETNNHNIMNNVDYSYNANNSNPAADIEYQALFSSDKQDNHETAVQQKTQNGSSEKTDQIAHAMNAAGITTSSETANTRAQALVNILTQKLRQGAIVTTPNSANNYPKTTSINAMSLQQALASILPPPLNQTASAENNQQGQNTITPQVLHIVQGKNSAGNQITLVDNTQQSVITTPNATPVLHIVQNKAVTPGQNSNSTPAPQSNTFSGLSLVDAGLQQGGNQLLHIVNTGNQKNNNAGQLLKRVNLLTNLTNVQGSNEQKMVQFVCKSADGKAIQLNAPHQRSMVLRLQPIESANVQPATPKPTETNQDLSPTQTSTSSANNKDSSPNQQEIKSRSVYEENYAKFIQNSSNKPTLLEKSNSLPKFNQAFGKAVFQDGNQKQNEINSNSLPANTSTDSSDCPATENPINLDHIGQISSPPLLLRKSPATQTTQAPQNLVQQIKQTITPMNIQTMHGGVIYTRQIPVNIGGGQTINLITVPSTELIDESGQKQQVNQGETIEPSIIKIVPQSQPPSNAEVSDEMNNDNAQQSAPQPQPVLTQMRIKLPMLSKTPQMVSGTRVVRPSFFQIQRNVIGGANQVYQQLVLTAAPPLGQQTIRLPQAQARQVKVPENQSSSELQMSSSTLEQLREFDMVLEQVKERSTVQPNSNTGNSFKLLTPSTDTTDSPTTATSTSVETTQVLYSIGSGQPLNVTYVNRKPSLSTPTTSTFVRSPDSSGIADSPTSSSHSQSHNIPHTSTSEASSSETTTHHKPVKLSSKSKSRPKSSSHAPHSLKLNSVPPKTSTQKPLEDEQTTQRILYILAEYKEQVENSPDKDKPAPRRRSNPPSNPSGSSKRKKSSSGSRRSGRDSSPIHGDDTCRTMGSEDSSCGTSQGDCNESCMDSHSPQDSPRKVARKLAFDSDPPTLTQPRPQPQRNVIVADGQTITVARGTSGKPTTTVLMPTNYILPVSMVKGGQQIAIVTNRGPKLLTVGGGEGGATNALLLQRLIGPAGLKPVLTRPGVRHVRLPTAALHNLQAFNLASATNIQPPDSTASPAADPPPDVIDANRSDHSPWTDRDSEVKPDRASSPDESEPWNLPSSADPNDYSYEETVRSDNMDRTVLDPIQDRYSPDMEAQRIFDKMFDVDTKKSYIVDSPRCGYDIDASDCDDKSYQVVHKKDSHRQSRLSHVSAAALRHKYAILEHELRLQKSLSEECEDLGVDSPSASELFPEAELLFAASPAQDHGPDTPQHSHTPQPTVLTQSVIQPDIDDQIATDQLIPRHQVAEDRQELDVNLGLEDVGIVTVSEDGMQATIALDQEEFARAHPNTTFHSEPTDDGVVHPFTMSNLKSRHITSTIFHSNRAPATVLMTAPQATVISQTTPETSHNPVKYSDIDNMIHSIPSTHTNNINLSSVLVKDDGLTRFDNILTDSRELHLSNTASAIVHSASNATQVIRRVCYDDNKRGRESFLMDEPDALIAGDDAKMVAEDSSRDATLESMGDDVDDDNSSPERHAELFWESNSASERSESRRPLEFSSDSEKCCKSPSYDETNSTDSSGVGTHNMRLDSVIKEARGLDRSDGSSADDTHPPLRTYPPKRLYHNTEGEMERSLSGKTRAGERSPDPEVRRRASGRGVVKRGCHCCNGSPAPAPAPPRPKKPRQRKPTTDFTN